MTDQRVPRREFLLAASAAGSMSVLAFSARAQPPSVPPPSAGLAPEVQASPIGTPDAAAREVPTCLSPTEWAFVEAACDVMIPADELSPSGTALGIPTFIDRQLGGAHGSGARLYRSGPFLKGEPQQGTQSALTPREFFGAGVAAVNALSRRLHARDFDRLTAAQQNAMLTDLDQGKRVLEQVPGPEFVAALLALVKEGFFSDPIHGGNRGKASWKMIGFPGLPALYADTMLRSRGRPYMAVPQSIADSW